MWATKKAKIGSFQNWPLVILGVFFLLNTVTRSSLTPSRHSFFIHRSIASFAQHLVDRFGVPGEGAMLFPSHRAATHCQDFILGRDSAIDIHSLRVLDFVPAPDHKDDGLAKAIRFSALFYPLDVHKHAKTFWQHTGEGVSSRRAEYCKKMFDEGVLVEKGSVDGLERYCKGPRRYRKVDDTPRANGVNGNAELNDRARFVEERFGRNLDLAMAQDAKLAIKRRIAGSLTKDAELGEALLTDHDDDTMRKVSGFAVDDVYLYSCGMNSIYKAHQTMLQGRGAMKSICFG